MIRLFEEQSRQARLTEEENRRKNDLGLQERIHAEDRTENLKKIPFRDDSIRNDLQNSFEKYRAKNCLNNLRICEDALGKEIGERKTKCLSEEKKRQLLWETSPELRELRKQLLMADVARDQAMQVAEKQALADLKRQEEESLAAAAEEEKRKFEEDWKRKEALEFQAKLKYHKDLDDLRQFKVSKTVEDEEQLRKEIEAIDEIKKQIEEEDKERERKRIKAQKELHRQAAELQKVRDELKTLEKEKEKTLEFRADEYRKAQELRTKQQEEEKQLSFEQKLQLQEELLSYLERMYSEKAKQELLWTELSIEEKEASEKEKTIAAEIRQKKIREELQKVYDMQMYVKKQKEELHKKEEELFRQHLMEKLYEEEKLDHMSQQKRRLKQAEHRRLAQELIEENRRKKAVEQAREMADFKLLKAQETERLRMIEEERRKFLSEHAKELLGYLPKRVFRDKQEIERLGDEFKKFYSRRNCSSLYQNDN